jgi:lysophospholipase L1-like esterase
MRFVISILFFVGVQFSQAQKVIVRQPVKFLALGDSYTIGQSVSQDQSWPYQFKNYLEGKGVEFDAIKVIAQTGWTTSNLKNAIENENLNEKFNLVSLLIGVNNQYQGLNKDLYVTEFEELLDIAIDLAGGKDYVFVLSIPDYGYTPFGESNREQISAEINDYNEINQSITEAKGVAYYYITDISRQGLTNPSLVASDGLHPSGLMYKEWVELIAQGLDIDEVTVGRNTINKNEELNVYVDSFNKKVMISASSWSIKESLFLKIYTMSGQSIISKTINNNTKLSLPQGIFVYHIFSKEQEIQGGVLIIN